MRELTIKEAVREYLSYKLVESTQDYPIFMNNMIESHGSTFEPKSNVLGSFEFVIVRLAIDTYKLWDIFSKEQATQISDEILFEHLRRAVDGETNKNMVSSSYSQYLDLVWQDLEKATINLKRDTKRSPLEKTTKQFLDNFLGSNIQEFYLSSNIFKDKKIIDPFLIAHCCHNLINYKVSWLAMKGNLKIL